MFGQNQSFLPLNGANLLIVIMILVPIGITSQVHADQQESVLSNKYIKAEAAFEDVIASVYFDYGRLNELTETGISEGSLFRVVYRYSASIYAKREPEHAVDYLIWRITQPNATGDGFSESKSLPQCVLVVWHVMILKRLVLSISCITKEVNPSVTYCWAL